jgi:hypothetical protein
MERVAGIGIGGVNLDLWCGDRIDFEFPDTEYQPFLNHLTIDPYAINIRIVFELGNRPIPSGFEKVFDCGETWSMLAREEERLIVHTNSMHESPFWAARFVRGSPEITLFCGEALIVRSADRIVVRNPVSYPLDLVLMMYLLAEREGAILHCAGAIVDGNGFIFPGRSGAGKSTLATAMEFDADVRILCDDRIVVRKIDSSFKAFGTPWLGTAARCRNANASLRGIAFISHGQTNAMKRITVTEALERLLPLVSVPWFDSLVMTDILQLCEELVSTMPCYELQFKPDGAVLKTVRETIAVEMKRGEI